ncbi:MAG TPA: response regulator [Patescibacteria group bacterium]|nr:response regulator [Patescibacteria group bacterium]
MAEHKTILVADDDPAICDSLCILLEDEGYAVEITSNSDTLPRIQEVHPDLVLLDIWLAGEDGREVCKKLKNNPETQAIPIIMISASKNAISAKSSGADEFLPKPFQINDLLEKIKYYTE